MDPKEQKEKRERIVIHGNEFYVIDLDCLERKEQQKKKRKDK